VLQITFRLIFGLVLLIWVWLGVSGWQPPPVSPEAEQFRAALFDSPYLLPAIVIVYFSVGLAYLTNRYVALASVLLFPISLNILLFHAFLNANPRSLAISGALFLANCIMLYSSRLSYRAALRATPNDDG
jgi:hypothetical protein